MILNFHFDDKELEMATANGEIQLASFWQLPQLT
jgi:hypothetical protein